MKANHFEFVKMNAFERDCEYDDQRKIVHYEPSFNTSSKLEFNILPDKRFLSLRDSILFFAFEIPDHLVVDNFCADALFQSIDLYINHELVTAKTSNADNYLTSLFLSKSMFNEPFLNITGVINGIYNDKNMDTVDLSNPYIVSRRLSAQAITKTEDNKSVGYHRYELCLSLNVGLGSLFTNHSIFKFCV